MAAKRVGRVRRCVTALATVTALAGGLVASTSVAAQANDQGNCSAGWSGNFHDIDYVLHDGQIDDFGGDWFSNHRPTSSAVVCWHQGRDYVEVAGTLTNDRDNSSIYPWRDVGVHIEVYNTSGTKVWGGVWGRTGFCYVGPCSTHIGSENGGRITGTNLDRIRIRTFVEPDDSGARTYSTAHNRYYAA